MFTRLLCSTLLIVTPALAAEINPVEQLLKDLDSLQATLKPAQAAELNKPFDGPERLTWTFFPGEQKGLPLKVLNEKQQALVLDVVKNLLSESGFAQTEQIRFLESVLHELENQNPTRDDKLYYLSLYGKPDAQGAWGIRWEGHHLSLSWTIVDGEVVASTPQFMGTNPGEVLAGPHKGLRVYEAEEALGFKLVNSLSDEQKEQCIINDTAPPEILTRIKKQARQLPDKGLAYKDMTDEQQGLLISIINTYAGVQHSAIALHRIARIKEAGLDDIKFAWMGATERGIGHYYRVQGSTFLIELDNTQNGANHTHAVWRDFEGDFGRDVLLDHYQAFHSK